MYQVTGEEHLKNKKLIKKLKITIYIEIWIFLLIFLIGYIKIRIPIYDGSDFMLIRNYDK